MDLEIFNWHCCYCCSTWFRNLWSNSLCAHRTKIYKTEYRDKFSNTVIHILWWHHGQILIGVGQNELNNMNCIVFNSDKNFSEGSTQSVYHRIRKFVAILRLVNFFTVRAQCIRSQISESSGTTVTTVSVEYLQLQEIILNDITWQSALSTAL